MPTQTFPCPFCAKKMGVGIELLGKKVRCPHCNQILVAPAPAATPVPPPPVAIPVAVAPPPPPPPEPAPQPDLPTFNLPTQEARESIFGEQEDESDDVFSSSDNKVRVPEMPPEPPAPEPSPPPPVVAVEPPPAPEPVLTLPLPTPAPDPAYAATVEVNNPFEDLAFEAPPPQVPPPPTPVAVPTPAPAPPPVAVQLPPAPAVAPIGATPPSSAGGNPWAAMDQLPPVPLPTAVPTLVPVPMPVPMPVPLDDSPFSEVEAPKAKRSRSEGDDEDRPAKRTRAAAATAGGNPIFRIGFFILAPYALLVTIAAIYGLFLKSSAPAGHPLANLPDNFGEFAPAEKRKTGKLPIAVDGEFPADQKVALGGKLEIGQLEVAPIGVEERRLKIVSEGKTAGKQAPEITGTTAIVLKMRIKNTSDDLMIHPLDPAFNRRITGSEKIGTGLAVGKAMYWGGYIQWPFPERVARRYEEAQAEEATPLKPGESRDYVVFTDANQRVVKAVKDSRDGLLWRVHVRRGRIDFNGKDIPVTAIIGVEFKSSDVKTPD